MSDAEILLYWRNDPLTKAMSINTSDVSETEHLAWLAKTLSNPARKLYVAEMDGVPVGTVRADLGNPTELSWTVAPEHRGNGYGKSMVSIAARLHRPAKAVIKPENSASMRIAEDAGLLIELLLKP